MRAALFEAIHVFLSVVEHQSFAGAAAALNMHRPAVTRAIQLLETELGVRLLNRTTRKISLTADGEDLRARSLPLLFEWEGILGEFSGDEPLRGQLRVDVPVALARSFIIPALTEFQKMHPAIELVLSSTDRKINLVSEGVDCAIRIGELEDSSYVSRQIGMCRMITCASPSYLDSHGIPSTIEDLDQHKAINFFKDHRRNILEWRFLVSGHEVIKKLKSGIVIDNSEVFLACGLAGHGLMQGVQVLFKPYLDNGELVEVLSDVISLPKPVFLVHPARPFRNTKVRAFADWIAKYSKGRLLP